MGGVIGKAAAAALKSILIAVASEAVIKRVIVIGLDALAEKTSNTIDDQIVAEIKKALT